MNKLKQVWNSKLGRWVAIAGTAVGLSTPAHAADYADVAAAVTAVTGLSATATTAFLGAATLGVGLLIVKVVAKVIRKGVSLG